MCHDPFGFNIDIYGNNIKWTVHCDALFIDLETASGLLRDIQAAFFPTVDADRQPGLTIGDVLRSMRDSGLT